MKKKLPFLLVLLCGHCHAGLFFSEEERPAPLAWEMQNPTADLQCPDQFHVVLDNELRMFHVVADGQFLGGALSSAYGQLDIYHAQQEKQWINLFDTLYDNAGREIATLKFRKQRWLLWTEQKIELWRGEQHLATLAVEEDGVHFTFRDGLTHQILAKAEWCWIRTDTSCFLWRRYTQDWAVEIVDRSQLQDRGISMVCLIWVLLKHSQQHLEDLYRRPYVRDYPVK